MNPPAVLLVNHTSVESGAELSLLGLLEELRDRADATLACPEGPLAEDARCAGVDVLPLGAMEGSLRLHPTGTLAALVSLVRGALALRRHVRRRGVDLVHAYSVRAGLAATLLPSPVPVIVHVHDVLPPSPLSRFIRALLTRRSASILVNSAYTGARFGGRPRIAYEGIDLARFDPARIDRAQARAALGLPADAQLLGVVAQITPWKGHDTAIRALSLVGRAHPRSRLVVVGDTRFLGKSVRYDNAAHLRALHALVAELGLERRVHFLGARDDVEVVMRALDVLLVPSWEEPLGRTVLEGMAMATPVVATAAGGPAEVIEDGVTGWLVPPREPGLWAAAIARVLDEPVAAAAVGERAQAAARRFGRAHHASAVIAAYEHVLERVQLQG